MAEAPTHCQDREARMAAAELILKNDALRIRFESGIDMLEIIDALALYLAQGKIPARPSDKAQGDPQRRAEAAE